MDNNLDTFNGWDEVSDETDFFKEIEDDTTSSTSSTDVGNVLDQVNDDSTTSEEQDEESQEDDKNKDPDLFSQEENTETDDEDFESEEDEEESEEDTETQSQSISTLTFLKDRGIVEYELEEGEELTDEKAEELIEDKFDEAVDNAIKETFDSLPEVVKQLNKFAINGGDVNEFFSKLLQTNTSSSIKPDIDLENESNQELVVREMLKAEGNDTEEIEAQISYYKDSGKLKVFSEKKLQKWNINRNKAIADLAKQKEDARKQEQIDIRESKRETSTFLSKNEEIQGLKFTKDDKKNLPTYINDKTVKLQNGNSITQMQKELFYDIPKNKEAYMQLATLLRNRNEDGTFNFESIIKNTKTQVTTEVRKNVRRSSKTSIPGKSGKTKRLKQRKLADYFN